MARTKAELLAAIQKELADLDKFYRERDELINEIEEIAKEIQNAAEQSDDWNLMNEGTRLISKITHVLSASGEEHEELQDTFPESFSQSTTELDDSQDNIAVLERILDKAKYSNALAKTLRATLVEILEEARSLKKAVKPPS